MPSFTVDLPLVLMGLFGLPFGLDKGSASKGTAGDKARKAADQEPAGTPPPVGRGL